MTYSHRSSLDQKAIPTTCDGNGRLAKLACIVTADALAGGQRFSLALLFCFWAVIIRGVILDVGWNLTIRKLRPPSFKMRAKSASLVPKRWYLQRVQG